VEQAFALPPLRQELRVEPGAPLLSGAPGYILFDPLRHLFFQLGPREQRVLAHWRRGQAHLVHDALVAEGERPEQAEDAIVAFHDFAITHSLTREPPGEAAQAFAAHAAAAKRDWWRWLLDHYLFVRVPLVRPAAFLARTLPIARRIWSPAGIGLLALVALAGLFLVTRQWDAFTASFAGLLTPAGLLAYAIALMLVKACHELGHAYMATRFGARVPAMGISFLVMMPVFYTDTSAAWRLRSRRQRVLIDAAGVLAELSVGAVALFLWSFLPDGLPRTAAFVLATTSLATSLLVNASPFMRFDGYYLLSDAIGVPNLAPRAFALARWWLRELLFALDEPPPEPVAAPLRRALIGYAAVAIAYRAALYIGIALLVYHRFFKALGLILFAVEVYVFLARPLIAEARAWQARGSQIAGSRRARMLALIGVAAIVAAFLPLDRSVTLPAVLAPMSDQPMLAGEPARIVRVMVELASPEIALGEAQAHLRIAELESRIARGVSDTRDLTDQMVMRRDLLAERDRLAGLARRRAGLVLRAGSPGRVVDLPAWLAPGMWTDARKPLLRIVSPDRFDVRALAGEGEWWRLVEGSTGRFVPRDAAAGSWRVRIASIGSSATRMLDQPAMAATNGGLVETVGGKDAVRLAKAAMPIHLVAERGEGQPLLQPIVGTVTVTARGVSLMAGIARSIGRIVVRESTLD
jgi:putative peptide zinc metalloprotease protein